MKKILLILTITFSYFGIYAQSVIDFSEISLRQKETIIYDYSYTNTSNDIAQEYLIDAKKLKLHPAYPNPAKSFIFFSYALAQNSRASIKIHNVLGSEIAEYELNPNNEKLKIHVDQFDAGVYFYTIELDGKSLATKKMIIKH